MTDRANKCLTRIQQSNHIFTIIAMTGSRNSKVDLKILPNYLIIIKTLNEVIMIKYLKMKLQLQNNVAGFLEPT